MRLTESYLDKLYRTYEQEIRGDNKPIEDVDHRPNYINAIPLIDIIRSVKGIKSTSSKTVLKTYNELIDKMGKEFEILIEIPINKIENVNKDVANVINAFRNKEINYTPGGGGTYGQIKLDL